MTRPRGSGSGKGHTGASLALAIERAAAARWVEFAAARPTSRPDLEDANVTRESSREPAYAAARQS